MVATRSMQQEDDMRTMIPIAAQTFIVAGAALVTATPALAGTVVPGPVLGAGAPALAVIAGGYWLIRRYRRR